MPSPSISICVPAYKQPDSLVRLLDSIRIQTFRDFEVIISDDSPDDQLELVAEKYGSDFELIYRKNGNSKGSPENWNAAVALASGEWIKIMHHDDWFSTPDALQIFINSTVTQSFADFFFCKSRIFNTITSHEFLYEPDSRKVGQLQEMPAFLFHANLIGAPSATMYRRSIQMTYDKRLIWLVDIEFYTRVILQHRIFAIPHALVTTAGESEHQLISSLRDDVRVELKEYLLCYYLLKDKLSAINLKIFRQRLMFLLQTFDLNSVAQCREAGYTGPVPFFIRLYFFLSAINRKMALKFLGKWVQTSVS